MVDKERLRKEFQERFHRHPRIFAAPGRVNLIGEHTDYNDGFVLPMAIDRQTVVAAAPREDARIRVLSRNLDPEVEFSLDHPSGGRHGLWGDYVEGVAQALLAQGIPVPGADLLLESDVPLGAGLSSSASLEISVGLALWSLSGKAVNRRILALAGQTAEHTYAGNLCGIMDQFIATFGEEHHALLIDCRSLDTKLVSMNLAGVIVVMCDTRVKHELSSSEYNTRRSECRQGVELLQSRLPGVQALRDVSLQDWRAQEGSLPEPVRSRCRHVVGENHRTLAAVEALQQGDLACLGQLMAESHRSLRDDYRVSCPELDLMVRLAQPFPGVYGARMTGGGFGGCTVNLVAEDRADDFSRHIHEKYEKETGISPCLYRSAPSAGAQELS